MPLVGTLSEAGQQSDGRVETTIQDSCLLPHS